MLETILFILLLLAAAAAITLSVLLFRATRRLIQYDDVFQMLVDDIETNLQQFYKMSQSSLLGNDAEIIQAHRNMMIMRDRLDEFIREMEEVSGLRLRTPKAPPLSTTTLNQLKAEVDKLDKGN